MGLVSGLKGGEEGEGRVGEKEAEDLSVMLQINTGYLVSRAWECACHSSTDIRYGQIHGIDTQYGHAVRM
jgi:hypothetical protein